VISDVFRESSGHRGEGEVCGMAWVPSGVQMDGYYVEEVIGRQAFEFVHPDDCASLRAQFSDVAGTPSTSIKTLLFVTPRIFVCCPVGSVV